MRPLRAKLHSSESLRVGDRRHVAQPHPAVSPWSTAALGCESAARVHCTVSIISRLLARFRPDDPDAPARLPSPDELTLLTRPEGEPEALMLQELLERAGIHAMVRNRDAATARGGSWGPPWAYELWVLRRDLRKAREIIGPDADPD